MRSAQTSRNTSQIERRLPVLMYHSVEAERSLIAVAAAAFDRQMDWLHARGYQAVPLGEIVERLHARRPLPPKTVALTFDDGFEGVYRHAFPALKRYGFRATVFLVAGRIGGDNGWEGQPESVPRLPLMGWEQIREMEAAGMEFGSHGVDHVRLDQALPEMLEYELCASRERLEAGLGRAVELFAYPYGQYSPEALEAVRRVYRGACTTYLGLASSGSDPHALERVDVTTLHPEPLFGLLGSGLLPVYLRQRWRLRRAAGRVLGRAWT